MFLLTLFKFLKKKPWLAFKAVKISLLWALVYINLLINDRWDVFMQGTAEICMVSINDYNTKHTLYLVYPAIRLGRSTIHGPSRKAKLK